MKTIRFFCLILFGALAVPAASNAQIADNDASISVLAVQCAVSSGFSANEYEDYCRRLAKTLSLLSSAQQTRVFGYLPMPGAASLGDSGANSSVSGSTENGTDKTAPTASNSLLDMVAPFNSLFDGTGSTSNGSTTATSLASVELSASVGGTTSTATSATVLGSTATVATVSSLPGDSASTPDPTSTTAATGGMTGTQSTGSSGGWGSLKAWFEVAEAAYKAGTLSSFLRGGN